MQYPEADIVMGISELTTLHNNGFHELLTSAKKIEDDIERH